MKQKIISCIIAANLVLSSLCGTSVAIFVDSGTSSMSLTAGRVEMQLKEIVGDGLTTDMNASIVNEGNLNADLWLENINRQQIDAAGSEVNDPSGMTVCGNVEGVTVEVEYKNEKTTFFINNMDLYDAPLLLLEDMEPGSEIIVTIRENKTEPATAATAPEATVETVLSMTELSEPVAEYEETPATQATSDPIAADPVDPSGIPNEVQSETTTESIAAASAPEPTVEETLSMPDLPEPVAEYEETPATQATSDPIATDPVDPSGLPAEAHPENATEPAVVSRFLTEDSLPIEYFEQQSIPVPYIFEFILKCGPFTSLTGESVFTLIKIFEANHQFAEPVAEYDETLAPQAAADPVDPSGIPNEVQSETTTESAAASPAPEPTVEAAPSMPDLSEPVAEYDETPAIQTPGDMVDPSDPPAEVLPENPTEPAAAAAAPEPTVETALNMTELSEFEAEFYGAALTYVNVIIRTT